MIRPATIAATLALTAGSASADFSLAILHTNDFHSRFEAISATDSTCSAEENANGECFGGWPRLVTAIKDARGRHEKTLLVDGGDQFQGTLFYTFYKGKLAAEMMNGLGYDAMTVGNHEFDDGPEVLRGFAEAIDFPILMSNADIGADAGLQGIIRKSVIVQRGGERIGLIGLTPQDTSEISSPGPNVDFTDPSEAVRGEVGRLTGEGIDKIVVLSHSGYAVDQEIARDVPDVDVIVGGHTHTLLGDMEGAVGTYPTMVGGTAIVQAYAYGKYLGELDVTFDDAGVVISASGRPVLIDGAVAEEGATATRLQAAAEPLDEIRNRKVAETGAEIAGTREICRAKECPMGNLVADAMLDRVRDQGIQVAIQNGGGVRASIDAGDITMGEVLTVLPFQNTLSTFRVTGATLREALESGVSKIEGGDGRFPQVAGITFTLDPSAEVGARVSDIRVDGAPLEDAESYGVVSNNYVRNGGNGYTMFVDAAEAYDFGPDLADVTAEYLARNTPYDPGTDGRIAIAGE